MSCKTNTKIIYKIIAIMLMITIILTSIIYNNIDKLYAYNNWNDKKYIAPNAGYGITDVRLEDFKYYERDNTYIQDSNNYHWYGTGLEFDFAIPQEAKEYDYFKLKLPDELEVSNKPMFEENEMNIAYSRLHTYPNKYGEKGMQSGNVFFSIYTKESEAADREELLKVYYTKKNEFTFVCTKNVNNKGVISGSGIIGDKVDLSTLRAFTDMHGRHYKGNNQASGRDSIKSSDEEYIGNDFSVKDYGYLYDGIRPNKILLSPSNGSISGKNGIAAANTKTVKFITKYGEEGKEYNLYAEANINYHTELYKGWGSGKIWNSHGNHTIQVIREDEHYVYFGLSTNATKGYNYNYTSTYGPHTYDIMGGNLGGKGLNVNEELFPPSTPFFKIDFNSFEVYSSDAGGGAPRAFIDFNKNNFSRLQIQSTKEYASVNGPGGLKIERIYYKHNDRSFDGARVTVKDRAKPYYIRFRAKKNLTNKEGIPLIRTDWTNNNNYLSTSEVYVRTKGYTIGDVMIKPVEYIASPALRLVKVDENGNILKNYKDKIKFKATDKVSNQVFINNIKVDGEISFPSLLNGHTYILEEFDVEDLPYKKSDEKYIVKVSDNGKINILKEKDSTFISKHTRPMYGPVEASDAQAYKEGWLTYKFKNGTKYSIKIKKTDFSNKIITGSKATFLLYNPDEYTKIGESITSKNGFIPREIETSYNGVYGVSDDVYIKPSNGKYALVEKTAPNGSSKIDKVIEFTVDNDGNVHLSSNIVGVTVGAKDQDDNTVISIANEEVTKVVINKYDAVDVDSKLDGVQFELLNSNKESMTPPIIETTDNNGYTVFDNIKQGTYYIREKTPKQGYSLNNKLYKVEVRKNGVRLQTTITPENGQARSVRVSSSGIVMRASVEDEIEEAYLTSSVSYADNLIDWGGGTEPFPVKL